MPLITFLGEAEPPDPCLGLRLFFEGLSAELKHQFFFQIEKKNKQFRKNMHLKNLRVLEILDLDSDKCRN